MATDILEQLADTKVPPAPVEQLQKGFSERLNSRLLVQQLLDLMIRGVPYAAWHMLCGMIGVLYYTVVGRFAQPKDKDYENRNDDGL
jgi:hypothetical protein